MYSSGPYSRGLMTGVSLGLEPPALYQPSHADSAPGLEEQISGPLVFTEPPSVLSEIISRHDREPVGWLPPQYPSPCSSAGRNLLPARAPKTTDPVDLETFAIGGQPSTPRDIVGSAGPASNSSAHAGSTLANSPSTTPSSPVPDQETSVGPTPMAQDRNGSSEPSPLQALREKERRKIRQRSGVKPKAKTSPRGISTATSSNTTLEIVECQWSGCTKRLHVDYVDVKHWGQHVREHYADQPEMVQCKWDGGCGAVISKSSMWKHIVVHQPKFKIRCPRGCDVFTRADMMRRHLQTCSFTSRQVAPGEKSGEQVTPVDRYGDGEDNEGAGKESWSGDMEASPLQFTSCLRTAFPSLSTSTF